MSITGAFTASQSGLRMTEKWAEVTSGNIANAQREGYVRRGLTLSGGAGDRTAGVAVTGLRREVNGALERMHRLELGRMARQDAVAEGLEAYAARLGQPGDTHALTTRLTDFQTTFDVLANNPADPSLQRAALEAAEALTRSLNDASTGLAEAAATAREGVRRDVESLNRLLGEVSGLNDRIAREDGATATRATLEDALGVRLDAISELMDLRVSRDAQGRVTLHSAGGTPLIEGGTVARVSYDAAAGRLTAGGIEITPGAAGVRGFEEGRLAGALALQNEMLPQMQLQLDEFARALVEGFQAADTSRAPGQAGLFTDAGAAYDPAQREGLAGRLSVNAAVRPEAGGALWRIRDGVGAAAPGAASDASQINAFLTALETAHGFDTQAGLGDTATLTGYAASLISSQQFVRVDAQDRLDRLQAGAAAIAAARSGSEGVNVDDELQQLTAIEQAYAANSQVMRTLGEMLDALLAAV
ncbi:flagellar hook-associated protein FlgK [Actibacterium sp. MT2.3-13A]|uniref:flagellar hook-associated protein FlgK n=1 Tax=Actibacterium sp. MT2.3-13A TaxID=2828332 RepID=UPI001BAA5C7A|nr:flagellar hook-associated protein FlgK [Actibacterium sp. MT2.3-13A]